MTERISHQEHRGEQAAHHESDAEQRKHIEKIIRDKVESVHNNSEKIPTLEMAAKEEAISGQDFPVAEKASPQPSQHFVSRQLKAQTFQRTMSRIRKQLSSPERTLSKIVHQPTVDAVSRASEKTIARPSGLLGGGICAFVGSVGLLWAAKHYGFQYNYLFFFLLFVGGFMAGMIIELLVHSIRPKRAED